MSALLTRSGPHTPARGLCAHDLSPAERERTPPHLRSPAERVLRALYDAYPTEGDWLARAPLLHTTPLTAAEWGLLKVAGKRAALTPEPALSAALSAPDAPPLAPPLRPARVSWCDPPAPPPAPTPSHPEGSMSAPFRDLRCAGEWLMRVAHARNAELCEGDGGQEDLGQGDSVWSSQGARRWRGARRVVAAALLTADLRPLLYALNQPEVSRTYHAEWAVLDGALRGIWEVMEGALGTQAPPHAQDQRLAALAALKALWEGGAPLTLLCTLKPCKMCAGAWVTYGPSAPIRVIYLEEDPGRLAQHTAFDAHSDAWRAAGRWGGHLERHALPQTPSAEACTTCTPKDLYTERPI